MIPKYRIDSAGRLLIKQKAQKFTPKGKFVIDKRNRLSYLIEESLSWRKKYSLPEKITFYGRWSSKKGNTLIFTLSKTKQHNGLGTLYFKSQLVSAQANALIFSLESKEEAGSYRIYLLKLKGLWQADAYNRLCFLVQKGTSRYDNLTLGGSWQVNENNTLDFSYKTTSLKRKTKIERVITFNGFWQISENCRIVYILDAQNHSYFSFKAHLERPNIFAKKGEIRYRVGIGVKTQIFQMRTITLYGAWKLSRKLGISFEMDYGQGKVKEIFFTATWRFSEEENIEFHLKNTQGKNLGLAVIFSRSFLNKNARWFLRLAKQGRDSRIQGGITILW
jgi:hypothetical protein